LRKSALIVATTVASFGVAAVAQAVDVDQSLTVKATGKKGTKAAPKPLKLDVTTGTKAKDPSLDGTYGTKSVVVHFDKNLKFNSSKFPTCSLATVASKPENCPKGSQVGAGSSSAVAGPGGQVKVNPSILAFNDKGNKLHLKLVAKPGEFDSQGILTGTLKKDTGKFGSKLDVPIPAKLQNNLGLFVTINRFNTVISNKAFKKGGKSYYYAESTGCTGGKYQFKGDFTLTDNTKDSVTTTAKC
jgi:hypothetical protein